MRQFKTTPISPTFCCARKFECANISTCTVLHWSYKLCCCIRMHSEEEAVKPRFTSCLLRKMFSIFRISTINLNFKTLHKINCHNSPNKISTFNLNFKTLHKINCHNSPNNFRNTYTFVSVVNAKKILKDVLLPIFLAILKSILELKAALNPSY